MVAPGNRRPGNSRRAQYGTFFGYLIASGGIGLGLVLFAISVSDSSSFAGLRSLAGDAASAPAQAAATGRTESQGLMAKLSGYFTSGSRVAKLEREVVVARVKLAEAEALKAENARLKALLDLSDKDPAPVAVVRLIGSTASSTRRYATLGAGSSRGVAAGMPVSSPLGLVGRVLEVGNSSARVLLITDTDSSVPVRKAGTDIQAYATGRGDGSLLIRLTNTGLNPLKPGDAMVTSGSGGLYPPGKAVAVVQELTRAGAIARPLTDPGMTEFVAVERAWDETQSPAPATASSGTS